MNAEITSDGDKCNLWVYIYTHVYMHAFTKDKWIVSKTGAIFFLVKEGLSAEVAI